MQVSQVLPFCLGYALPTSAVLKSQPAATTSAPRDARDWMKILAQYKQPDEARSILEIVITALPFIVLWIAAWAALSVGYWLTLLIAIPAAGFLVRLFMIQHDCGHGAFFHKRTVNDWVGRVIGVFTLTPYDVWRRSHATHHATSGNLDERGTGDIDTLTVREYLALPPWRRMLYRAYRHPIVMFGIGPAYLFILQHRLPVGLMRAGWQPWISALLTNLGIAVVAGAVIRLVGLEAFQLVQLPITIFGASIGVWLFYIQHQFEETHWAEADTWTHAEAALHGSSHYDLPAVLRWFTANIGVHHVHHLYSRIPYYRLSDVLRDHPALADVGRITLWESFSYVKLRLWDQDSKRMVSLAELRAMPQAA